MFQKIRIVFFIFITTLSLQTFAQGAKVSEVKDVKEIDTHLLIGNLNHKFDNGIDCDISVLVSRDFAHVKVFRVDNRKGAYNVNYLNKSPSLFQSYGHEIDLEQEVQLNGAVIESVSAKFDLKDDKHDLKLIIRTHQPASQKFIEQEKIFPLGREFFLDRPVHCLK